MNSIRLAKIGKNALTSTNPNDFVFNTDYNTPQIVKEGSTSPTLGTTGTEVFTNLAHELNYTPFSFAFVKFANSRVGPVGSKASNAEFFFTNYRVNATNARFGYINNTGGNYTPTFKYLATEIPLAGTPSVAVASGNRLVVSKTGVNALTDTNPNNKIFDSQFGTLKYYDQGTNQITIGASTPAANVNVASETVLVTHNLGYYPFFGAHYEFSADDPGKAYIMPSMFASGGFWNYNNIYSTTTQLIFRRDFGNAFGGIPYSAQTIKVYWKVYSRNLGF